MTASGARRGGVLAVAVLALVALQLLAHGLLLLARFEDSASEAGLRLLQARAAADAGAALAVKGVAAWDSVPWMGRSPTATATLGEGSTGGDALRLSREYWMVRGMGRPPGADWGVTVEHVFWVLDPVQRVVEAKAAAEVGGLLPPSPSVWAEADLPPFCAAWEPTLDSLGLGPGWNRAVPLPAGGEALALGRLDAPELLGLLPALAASAGSPEPVALLGMCDTRAPWNWGDPERPEGPCGSHLVARGTSGDLRLEGGVGQGILAVGKDLELVGTRFDGVVLVGGTLSLRDGARVRGLVRVAGDLLVTGGEGVVGSPCRALRALTAFREPLRRPLRIPQAGVAEGPLPGPIFD